MNGPNWGEFDPRVRQAEAPAAEEDFDAICGQVLNGVAGQKLLEALRQRYFETGGNPLATEAVLRVRAAHQQMIRDMENARDRYLERQRKRD